MTRLLRWGRSAYETDASLALEQRALSELGVVMLRHEGEGPPVDDIEVLVVTSGVHVDEALLLLRWYDSSLEAARNNALGPPCGDEKSCSGCYHSGRLKNFVPGAGRGRIAAGRTNCTTDPGPSGVMSTPWPCSCSR